MKRIFSLLMALCLMFCGVLPVMAMENPAVAAVADSGSATPTQEITPFSDFTGGGTEFFTKIRLTVTDRDGNPIAGAVYGLYSKDGTLVETLTTDETGTATSGDIPMETDYYVVELTAPEGYQPNSGRHEINLTEVCAPSRIDVSVEYDNIMGRIKVIKTDEDGNPLEGVGFTVYRQSPWEFVDDITTGADGTATTMDLPYGTYELSEYNTPDGLAADSWYYATIWEHDATVETTIVNYPAKGDVKITKTGNDGRKIAGAVFEIYSADTDTLVQTVTTGSGGYVWSSYMPLGNYYAVEKSVPAPYLLDTTRHDFSLTYHYQSIYLNIENVVEGDSGRVKVIKTDDSDNPLSGVVFDLYRAWDSKKLATLTTDENGLAESDELIPGDYYLTETTGVPGYTVETGQIPFTIDGSGETVEKTVVNPKIRIFGAVKVTKQNDAGTPIPGVKFGVYCDAKDYLIEELTTGADGTATSGVLNEGDYYLLELETPDGYLPSTEKHPFAITENNVTVPVSVENQRISGSVKVIKTGTDGELLSGVKFGIYSAQTDAELETITTDWEGIAASGTLYYGDYYLKELETVDGYELIDTPIPFSISEQDATLEIPVNNPLILGGVSVFKLSGQPESKPDSMDLYGWGDVDDTHKPLGGAVFGIYNQRGQKLAELVTDESGFGRYDGLPKGDYFLKELSAPEGFVLIDELIPFEIWNQGDVFETVVYNPEGYGVIEVQKSGEDEMLSGVAFDIYRTATDEKVGSMVTDADGLASLELPLGRYYLVEAATAPGYMLLPGHVSFSLTADGETVMLPILNQKEQENCDKGQVKVLKRDADTDVLLPGAAYGICRVSDDSKVAEVVTATDGTGMSQAIPAGDYYLLELRAPDNYAINEQKFPITVTAGETTEFTVYNKRLPEPDPEPKPEPPAKPGTLRIVKVDRESGKSLPGAVFGVYRDTDDKKLDTLTTGKNGTTELALPAGDYYIRELEAPKGYTLSKTDINFHLESGATRELTVKNSAEDEPEKLGLLELTKEDGDTGKALRGAVFAVYTKDNEKIDELTTGRDGVAERELPVGSYYLRELKAPKGYQLDRSKVNFKITEDKTTRVTVENDKEKADPVKPETPKPEQPKPTPAPSQPESSKPAPSKPGATEPSGKVRLVKQAAGSGALLPGAVFGVYTESGSKLSELTSGADGSATLSLPVGRYYLKEQRAPYGYKPETARIRVDVLQNKTTLVEVTNEVDPNALPLPEINVPQTGIPFPTLSYTLAALLFGVAALCAVMLSRTRKHTR